MNCSLSPNAIGKYSVARSKIVQNGFGEHHNLVKEFKYEARINSTETKIPHGEIQTGNLIKNVECFEKKHEKEVTEHELSDPDEDEAEISDQNNTNDDTIESKEKVTQELDVTLNESKLELTPTCMDWKFKNVYSLSNNINRRSFNWKSKLAEIQSESDNENEGVVPSEDSLLNKVREYLADYQESRGIPRAEYTFSSLATVMFQATGNCLLALFYVILYITPIAEIFLHISRFIIDKVINIKNTTDARQIVMKCILFFIELLSVGVCILFIFGYLVLPVIKATYSIIAKIMLCD